MQAISRSETYLLHGMRVRSEVPLDAPPSSTRSCDMQIAWGERRAVANSVPPGRLLASLSSPAGSHSLTVDGRCYRWRLHDLCEFVWDRARSETRVHLAPDAAPQWASLLAGGFLATVLTLEGRCMLHASAVETEGQTVAFIAGSGMGKSTIAALCCAAGARLVTDDVLRVEPAEGDVRCFSGSHTVRLRPAAAALAGLLGSSPRTTTTDGRAAVRPESTPPGMLALRAVVAPRCTRSSRELRVTRLGGAEAVLELLRWPRTLGWVEHETARAARELDVLARVAETTPVYRAELPWGPPFEQELGGRLMARIGFRTPVGADAGGY